MHPDKISQLSMHTFVWCAEHHVEAASACQGAPAAVWLLCFSTIESLGFLHIVKMRFQDHS